MRITEGYCAHCSEYVVWDEERGLYVAADDSNPGYCWEDEPHSVPAE